MGPEHIPQRCSGHIILHRTKHSSWGFHENTHRGNGLFLPAAHECPAAVALVMLASENTAFSSLFFFCQNIHSSLPAEAHEVSEKTTQQPVFTCSLKFAVPKHPRRWRRNLSGWRARAKTRKCQWVLDREEQRCARVLLCAHVKPPLGKRTQPLFLLKTPCQHHRSSPTGLPRRCDTSPAA